MKSTFFARYSLIVLMVVMFLVPFALRGARFSLQSMKNDIKDWLPSEFDETRELAWFARHFAGEQFVIATWPGCTADDPRFKMLVEKLRAEVAPAEPSEEPKATEPADEANVADRDPRAPPTEPTDTALRAEIERARKLGDELGLHTAGDYFENWGGKEEKWIKGDGDQWYFVTPAGELFRWNGSNNLPSYLVRRVEKFVTKKNVAEGEFVAQFGRPTTTGHTNAFHTDPRKLTARFFKSISTGPDILAELSAVEGPLWPRGPSYAGWTDEAKHRVARERAYQRLAGSLFGPQPPAGFEWTASTLADVLPEKKLRQLPDDWQATFDRYVGRVVDRNYNGELNGLVSAAPSRQALHWFELFHEFDVEPPAPQTALMVTLSEAGKRDLSRVVGRPVLGKPRGKLLELAIGECNVPTADFKLGGPPIDNVAIDEEGTITLLSLVSYSALVGFILAYISFRSLKVTMMVFFVGGTSAIASLAFVWWSGVILPGTSYSSVDAILLSMPSLIYVLGLSGAVHIVNYYREAAQRNGLAGAPETAVSHGWWPCTLAAFTTSLGLVSLCTSNILPIKKFGLFSALGTMFTLALLFSFLPAALQMWAPRFGKRRADDPAAANGRVHLWIERFWERIGAWIITRHWQVATVCVLAMLVVGAGLWRVNTSVQLLKLFDGDAKIIKDYEWLETHLGKLVPMELVLKVDPQVALPTTKQLAELSERGARNPEVERYQLNLLERMEISESVGREVERAFGEEGSGVLGRGLRASTFLEELPDPSALSLTSNEGIWRSTMNSKLEESRLELFGSDYARIDRNDQSELWRVSLRLGALNDVDYGQFVSELKKVVEPVLSAYRYRQDILELVAEQTRGTNFSKGRILILGAADPRLLAEAAENRANAAAGGNLQAEANDSPETSNLESENQIDQTKIFARTLNGLLLGAGVKSVVWHDPTDESFAPLTASEKNAEIIEQFDCVVVAKQHTSYDAKFVEQHARSLIVATDHLFDSDAGTKSAAQRDDAQISCVYTGIVPIVYKAQRTLLESLINSIALAFVMIALVMMFLLRNGKLGIFNFINTRAGMISMLPNIFPVVLIFGAMGHLGVLVDIGSMMTASVAMGVAVDDTIHFLSWFRKGLAEGRSRASAIRLAYKHVAMAMTQTTLIGGLGLSVFALSTFTPTQGFGIMMLTLLVAALVGDLVFLPALLAGPLGAFFEPRRQPGESQPAEPNPTAHTAAQQVESTDGPHKPPGETPHSNVKPGQARKSVVRRDDRHDRLGH